MARSQTQVERSLANRITDIDTTVDVNKGAVPDIFIVPEATEIRALEQRQDSVGLRYSVDYVKLQDRDIQILYGANHGMRPSRGSPSTARGIAYRYTRPSENVVIAAGRLVSTDDESVTFKVLYDTVMYASRSDSYYNASKRRYEVPVVLQSVGTGVDFEVPARTLRKLKESIAGIDGMENVERATPSKPEEDLTEFARRVQAKFNGLEYASADGLSSIIRNYAPTIVQDVIPVFSSDVQYFQRRTRRAAWDLYLRGSRIEDTESTFTANGSAVFSLPNAPVVDVTEVRVNNLPTTFMFIPDTSPERRGSVLEYALVQLPSAPAIGSIVTVRYTWNSLIAQVQNYFNTTRVRSYKTDILIRSAQEVLLRVRVDVLPTSTFDPVTVLDNVRTTIYEFFDDPVRREIVTPESFRSYVQENTAGVSKLYVRTFTKASTGTMNVEPIDLAPFEYVNTNDNLLTVMRT